MKEVIPMGIEYEKQELQIRQMKVEGNV